MKLTERLRELISACFTGIWVETCEQHEALAEIIGLCRDEQWNVATWDLDQGMSIVGSSETIEATDPIAAIRAINGLKTADGTALLVMKNLHRFINSADVMQAIERQLTEGKQDRTILVALSPIVQIPPELEKMFVVVEHAMPDHEQLIEIALSIATEESELPTGVDFDQVLEAAGGLTRSEAESAFSLSLVRYGELKADVIWELKAQMLKKSGLLTLHRGNEDFSSLGGLAALKTFTKRALLSTQRSNSAVRPRGVLLLSPPGCGKSQFCKSLGKETGRPVLTLDVGSLMGSLVGQSEERTRRALQIVDAMAPCVLMIDEIEKAFAGVGSSGQSDSGVTARVFGNFLTWLNDHQSDVFVVATSNEVSKLPPEFGRSERFDGIVFVDLPGRKQKDLIWEQYVQLFELDADQSKPGDKDWTGAEIRACCRLAALLDIPLKQSAQNIVPIAVTAAEAVNRNRSWASGRCLDAEKGGIYQFKQKAVRRKVKVDPSLN